MMLATTLVGHPLCGKQRGQRHLTATVRNIGILAVSCLLVVTPGASAHLDPPGPPKWEELVYLHTFVLTEDLDDWFNGETELMVRIQTTHAGHQNGEWFMVFEDIDMDGPLSTNYTVLDETLAADERKGGKALFYNHFECDPVLGVTVSITAWEVDKIGVGNVIKKLGKAAAKLKIELPGNLGDAGGFVGKAAEALGNAINGITNGETPIGTNSAAVPLDISSFVAPTTKYKYKTQYDKNDIDADRCEGTEKSTVCDRRRDNSLPQLPQEVQESYQLIFLGFDEDHPFTKDDSTAQVRMSFLYEALDAIDAIAVEPGGAGGDIPMAQDAWRNVTVEIPQDALMVELAEAKAGVVAFKDIADATDYLNTGNGYFDNQLYTLALDQYIAGIKLLLPLNHSAPPVSCADVPTVSQWGLIVMSLLVLTAGTLVYTRRRPIRA